MKRNVYGIFAIALAVVIVALSAFKNASPNVGATAATPIFVTYDGDGPQDDITNYNFPSMITSEPQNCPGETSLCWFKVTDRDNDNDIDDFDFEESFKDLDDGDGTLNDEAEIDHILSLRSN